MNLDRLKKLVKLANNNPNENEANAAARKVCSIIAEADFKFTADEPSLKRNEQSQSNADFYNDIWSNLRNYGFGGRAYSHDWETKYRDNSAKQQSEENRRDPDYWKDRVKQDAQWNPEPGLRWIEFPCSKCGVKLRVIRMPHLTTRKVVCGNCKHYQEVTP